MAMWCTPAGTKVASTAPTPCQRAGVVVDRRAPRVEDGLVAQRAVLVDVDEGLVLAVVGEERGVERDAARAGGGGRRPRR